MLNWFSKTFESAQQQATLFSIVLSTTLAIALLLLNQWFNTRKDKRVIRIEKLEEFASTVYSYERLCFDIISRIYQKPPSDPITIDKMVESVELADKIEMLSSLYFPDIKFNPKSTQKMIYDIHRQFDTGDMYIKSKSNIYISYSDATKDIKKSLSELKELVK
ncbi:hypothetical protein GBN24_06670 [Plesiomonas shigelloides]|uniref:hypothetical protein n=1 Tax=Plesiomonas shigelloides TaxID=703 RepID=UPI0012624DA7|nr:hypothetical protein [Plesiomonas shigelloides]KAB7692059.1 hypothetical protein GBN24_06670 [Plesiomonas shigelloides]